MKRKVLSAAAIVGFALLAFSMVSIAQPVRTGGGLSRVTTTGSAFEGSGTTTNPLKLRTDCANGSGLAYNSGATRWDCAALGGVTGTGTSGKVPRWTGASTLGDSSISDDGAAATVGNFRGTVISPTAITGTQNDWNPTGLSTATTIRVDSSATSTITGISGGAAGRQLTLINVGSNAVNYNHEDAGSTAANRLALCAGDAWQDIGGRNDSVTFVYVGSTSRWQQVCRTTLPRLYVVGSTTLAGPASIVSDTVLGDEASDDFTVSSGATFTSGDTRGATLTPSALSSGNTNNYAPTSLNTARTIFLQPHASGSTLTGLTGGVAGRFITLCADNGNSLFITNEDTSSTAANRFWLTYNVSSVTSIEVGGTGQVGCIDFVYDGGNSRWRHLALHHLSSANIGNGVFTAFPPVVGGLGGTNGKVVTTTDTELGNADADQISLFGKPYTRGSAPSLSSCGTSPSIVGNDKAGTVTMGTGSPTGCVVTFNASYSTNAPICVVRKAMGSNRAIDPQLDSTTTSAMTITLINTTTASGQAVDSFIFNYLCLGRL